MEVERGEVEPQQTEAAVLAVGVTDGDTREYVCRTAQMFYDDNGGEIAIVECKPNRYEQTDTAIDDAYHLSLSITAPVSYSVVDAAIQDDVVLDAATDYGTVKLMNPEKPDDWYSGTGAVADIRNDDRFPERCEQLSVSSESTLYKVDVASVEAVEGEDIILDGPIGDRAWFEDYARQLSDFSESEREVLFDEVYDALEDHKEILETPLDELEQ